MIEEAPLLAHPENHLATSQQQQAIYRRFLNSARRSAAIYGSLARMESDDTRTALFKRLCDNEMEHAAQWAELIGRSTSDIHPTRLGLASIILWLTAKMIGTSFIAKFLIRGHEKNLHDISRLPDPTMMADAAREQELSLRRLAYPDQEDSSDHHEGGFLAGKGGTLRAAVLGVNDGLVSNFSLVMGVAGGTGNSEFVVIAGIAGLLAGAFSMAAGEYISMRSQKDVYENIVHLERAELALWPEREAAELAGFYEDKGLSAEEATMIATRLSENPEIALDIHLREEFGLNQDDLGSPWGAAFASMIAFALGAIVPVLPYLFGESDLSLPVSALLSGLALVTVGAGLAWMSSVNSLWGGARMLLIGGAAAAVTYGVGTAIGQTIN
jgi:VIT1/CCC1 family predicted Fe2+/Mn2+ transporter